MEVLKPRAAFLSNYEVFSLLQEMEQKQLEQTRAIMATKKEENTDEQYKGPNFVAPEDIAENVRTIQVELLQYLRGNELPTSRQTEESVAHLTRSLRNFGLTKAEKLQIVNLAPQSQIDLYVIVEDIEERLSEHMDEILTLVKEKSPGQPLFLPIADPTPELGHKPLEALEVEQEDDDEMWGEDDDPSQYQNDDIFDEDGFEPGLEIDEVAEHQD